LKHLHFTVLIGLGLAVFAGLTRWNSLEEQPIIQTDGQGYHAYLPAVFIYQDLQFSFIDPVSTEYYGSDKMAEFIVPTQSGNVNKYFVGAALMQTPFFLSGCVLSWFVGVPVDGYSWPFQLMVGLAAIFYVVLGLWFLERCLLNMGFRKKQALIAVLVLLFGTDLLYYTLYEPSMSHAYSFFTVSAFLYFMHRAIETQNASAWILSALTLGLTVLIRPSNGLIVLVIPVVAGDGLSALNAIELLFKKKRVMLFSFIALVGMVAVQVVIYMVQTGKLFVWSYKEEGFNFASPEIFNVLFSYRKGLFVYSPVLFLATGGMIAGISKGKARYAWLLLFLSVVTWVISSWWMWYYGGCFGQRAFIDYLPFFGIGLAFVFQYGWGFLRPWFFYAVSSLLIGVQLVQTYQYVNNILPFDNMSKTKYWNLFLRTGDDLAWYYSGYEGQDSYTAIDSSVAIHDMETPRGWGNEQQLSSVESYNGTGSSKMSTSDQYGITYRKAVSSIPFRPNLVRISCWTKADSRTTNLSLVCSIEDSTGAVYFWKKYPLRPQFAGRNKWSLTTALFKCNFPRDSTDKFVIYPMKSDDATVHLDDLEVSFVHAK